MDAQVIAASSHKDIGGPMKTFWLRLAVWSYSDALTARRAGHRDLARLHIRKCREWLECACDE